MIVLKLYRFNYELAEGMELLPNPPIGIVSIHVCSYEASLGQVHFVVENAALTVV